MATQPRPWNDWMRAYNRHSNYKCGECVYFASSEPEQLCAMNLRVVSRNNNACSKGKAKKTNHGGTNGNENPGLPD